MTFKNTSLPVTLAAIVIVISGMKLSSPILVPFILAVFLAVILSGPMTWLKNKGIPKAIALVIMVLFSLFLISLITMTMSSSLTEFQQQLPLYEKKLHQLWIQLSSLLHLNGDMSWKSIQAGKYTGYISSLLSSISSSLAHMLLVMTMVLFMLLEADSFHDKCTKLNSSSADFIEKATRNIRSYLGIKTVFCLITGTSVWLLAIVLKIPYPELWGLLAGLLNYIPNIGSIIAAVPAIAIALLQYGVKEAVIFGVGILSINMLVGSVLEPKYMGKGLGLSVLVVFLSLTFWGWLFGPIGMLLSVPLTMTLKLMLESKPETKHLAQLLSE